MADFALWLNSRYERPRTGMPNTSLDDEMAIGLGKLYKHARHYVKTALANTPLKGGDDFAFLATLQETGDLRKSELIRYNFIEFSPGMEVIRRLIRRGLIEDYDDPEDGRSKKVRVTAKGRAAFMESLSEMAKASKIISGGLAAEEKGQFLHLARKLLHFHQPIWENDQGTQLDEIMEKYTEA